MRNMKYCPYCGKEIIEGAKFCGACGKAVLPTPTKPPEEYPQPVPSAEVKRTKDIILGVSFAIVLVLLLISFASSLQESLALPGGDIKLGSVEEAQLQVFTANQASRMVWITALVIVALLILWFRGGIYKR